MNTVAAGGGSRLFFRSGMFVVGPESAGAHPGLLEVTDKSSVQADNFHLLCLECHYQVTVSQSAGMLNPILHSYIFQS